MSAGTPPVLLRWCGKRRLPDDQSTIRLALGAPNSNLTLRFLDHRGGQLHMGAYSSQVLREQRMAGLVKVQCSARHCRGVGLRCWGTPTGRDASSCSLQDSRMHNTFNTHRLLHWASLKGRKLDLKLALLTKHFTNQCNLSDDAVRSKTPRHRRAGRGELLQHPIVPRRDERVILGLGRK